MSVSRRSFLIGTAALAPLLLAPGISFAQDAIRENVTFASGADRCAAWLYRPSADVSRKRPVVVMGHGLGCVKEMRLDAFAARFAAAGYIVLAFDYRHFGASTGEPRQLLDIGLQHSDWHAAIAYARALPGVDPEAVALFGTSFSGGHVLEIAKADPRVAAVVSQCPFTDGAVSSMTLGLSAPKALALAAEDLAQSSSGQGPVMIPLAGRPGEVALMNAADVLDGYLALVPPGMAFTNAVHARVAADIPLYFPGKAAAAVKAPILFGVCDNDTVAPPVPTLEYARSAPAATVRRYPVGHFDIYLGAAFEAAVADYVPFLLQHVPPPKDA
ncbi:MULTISPECIES: alpha/beta hydrolase [unclassified Nocardia]|uniref:alpha/beta hydrolase n=1 Tax=unclassified Nocardia TaxID=2637762 RepID=UPI0033A96AB5